LSSRSVPSNEDCTCTKLLSKAWLAASLSSVDVDVYDEVLASDCAAISTVGVVVDICVGVFTAQAIIIFVSSNTNISVVDEVVFVIVTCQIVVPLKVNENL